MVSCLWPTNTSRGICNALGVALRSVLSYVFVWGGRQRRSRLAIPGSRSVVSAATVCALHLASVCF